ncbi:unnamed protein product [Mytilus edulis]|uniref:Uncharacterized protein n=1 Tax=Mytilus edulis TaxID=6550 RepID=A0A8S3U9L0_MYTED|nr:unnamed protein product [Mytilus edulis]
MKLIQQTRINSNNNRRAFDYVLKRKDLVVEIDSDESDSILSPPKKSKYEAACNSSARSAYQLCGRDVADAIIYHGLSDYLEVSRAYNDMGHFIKKMTNLELELKRLENKDGIGAAATSVVEEVLPTTKGGRSSTQNSNINTKARAKAAKGARTSMIIADGCVQDITIPGEVASLDTNMPLASIKSVQQMNLDNRMHRHMND